MRKHLSLQIVTVPALQCTMKEEPYTLSFSTTCIFCQLDFSDWGHAFW